MPKEDCCLLDTTCNIELVKIIRENRRLRRRAPARLLRRVGSPCVSCCKAGDAPRKYAPTPKLRAGVRRPWAVIDRVGVGMSGTRRELCCCLRRENRILRRAEDPGGRHRRRRRRPCPNFTFSSTGYGSQDPVPPAQRGRLDIFYSRRSGPCEICAVGFFTADPGGPVSVQVALVASWKRRRNGSWRSTGLTLQAGAQTIPELELLSVSDGGLEMNLSILSSVEIPALDGYSTGSVQIQSVATVPPVEVDVALGGNIPAVPIPLPVCEGVFVPGVGQLTIVNVGGDAEITFPSGAVTRGVWIATPAGFDPTDVSVHTDQGTLIVGPDAGAAFFVSCSCSSRTGVSLLNLST